MPSILGGLVTFGVVIGPAYASRWHGRGTLLRQKAVPNGVTGYVTSRLLFQCLSLLARWWILVPGFLLFDGLMIDGRRLVDGRLGAGPRAPRGDADRDGHRSLVPSTQKVGTWGCSGVGARRHSGNLYPIQRRWGWVEVVAQVFPMYWLGLGMRSAFLPDGREAGDRRQLADSGDRGRGRCLGGRRNDASPPSCWGAGPVVQSGSQVEAAREQAVQWVR